MCERHTTDIYYRISGQRLEGVADAALWKRKERVELAHRAGGTVINSTRSHYQEFARRFIKLHPQYKFAEVWDMQQAFINQELIIDVENEIWSEQTQIIWEQAQKNKE